MNSPRIIFWLLMLSGWIAFQTGAPAIAQASCGDYLIGQRHAFPMPVLSGDQTNGTEPANSPYQRTPCNGPGCQKAPAEPISPVPIKLSVPDHDRLGYLMADLPLPISNAATFEITQQSTLTFGHPLLIEHPPRA